MSTSDRPAEDRPQEAVLAGFRHSITDIMSRPAGGDTISPDDPEYRRAKKRALSMLAARDHAAAELRSKLLAKEHPEDVVDTLLARLAASHLLDDEKYAISYVRSQRAGRALSVSALRRQLAQKGVAEPAIEHAVEDLDDEFDIAYGIALKKARSTSSLPDETRLRRVLGMLARRGYPSAVAMAAAQQALEDS